MSETIDWKARAESAERQVAAVREWKREALIDLNELERLLTEATPGPWAFDSYSTVHSAPRIQEYEFDESVEPDVCKMPRTGHGDLGTVQGAKDAELIVAAVNALPSLIRELRELRADRERLD